MEVWRRGVHHASPAGEAKASPGKSEKRRGQRLCASKAIPATAALGMEAGHPLPRRPGPLKSGCTTGSVRRGSLQGETSVFEGDVLVGALMTYPPTVSSAAWGLMTSGPARLSHSALHISNDAREPGPKSLSLSSSQAEIQAQSRSRLSDRMTPLSTPDQHNPSLVSTFYQLRPRPLTGLPASPASSHQSPTSRHQSSINLPSTLISPPSASLLDNCLILRVRP